MISIIGGNYKKAKIEVPSGNSVRPTSSLKKEAIFSILESIGRKNFYDIYKNYCFVDFFAGSGSLGLEASSRGASYVYFFEKDKKVLEILKKNCKKICKKNNYTIYNEDILNFDYNKFLIPVSVIFMDPPYSLNPFNELLKKFDKKKIINKKTIIVIETDINQFFDIPKNFHVIEKRKYKKTKIIFLKIY